MKSYIIKSYIINFELNFYFHYDFYFDSLFTVEPWTMQEGLQPSYIKKIYG